NGIVVSGVRGKCLRICSATSIIAYASQVLFFFFFYYFTSENDKRGLSLSASIWTQDQDFFGCGIAIWTTDTLISYLANEC
ncbi:PIN domain-containing protein, partial [Geminocystis sp.]|uniref:PIN domain-containing protein n=1 Tax=Geminocystis sp. TaxID=2664100 RepID=UPI003593B5F2